MPDEPARKPSVPVVPLSPWQGAADPAYLLAEVEELRGVASEGGLGTLAYLLECAAIECRHQLKLKQESWSEDGPSG
jgi:hypothetical protein